MPSTCAHGVKMSPSHLRRRKLRLMCTATNCCNAPMEMDMARAIEQIIDWMLGPFARELARMPASSFRYLLNGF